MDYYQGVVLNYLRADRAVFVNPECCIQLEGKPNPDSDKSWYCDAVALDLRSETVFLCEISYEKALSALIKRLRDWSDNWPAVKNALARDCKVSAHWTVRPWLFIPENSVARLVTRLAFIEDSDSASAVFHPRITSLESVQPWNYCSWNHQDHDTPRTDAVPAAMRL